MAAPPPTYRVRIFYSFCNLNQEWVPAQVLAVDTAQPGPISGVSLYVQASRTVPGGPAGDHDAIVVSCSYTTTWITGPNAVSSAFTLTPELYGLRVDKPVTPPRAADASRIFAEPAATAVDPAQVVRFNAPADSPDGPWVSVDHKGGSFLRRPVTAHAEPQPLQKLASNTDLMPMTWDRIDAAFQTPDGARYFFDNARQRFLRTPNGEPSAGRNTQSTSSVWGSVGANLTRGEPVDAAMMRDGRLFVFAGDEYYCYSGNLGQLDRDYPKRIDTNKERLPAWTKIDTAFVGPDRTEYFYLRGADGVRHLEGLDDAAQAERTVAGGAPGSWTPSPIGDKTYLIFGDKYVPLVPDDRPEQLRALAKNPDHLPETPPSGPSVLWRGGVLGFNSARQKIGSGRFPAARPRPGSSPT